MPEHPPNIAIVTDAIGPFHHGGKEQRYLELAPRLARRADVHVYTMKWWDGPATRHADGVVYHAICPLLPLYVGDGRRSIRQALIFALACLRLLTVRFDVLEADHMPYFPLLTLKLVALIRRRRLFVTWHEYWGLEYWRSYMGGRAGLFGGLIEAISTRLPDGIIAASPQTAERLREIVKPDIPIMTAPNGVDLMAISEIEPSAESADLVVVGRLAPHKRVDLLLESMRLLAERGSRPTARVIGSGPEYGRLRARAEALGLDRQVRFETGIKDHRELLARIKAARVAVFPSEREGFGIAVLEALACGVPVVTTSAPDNLAQHLVLRAKRGGVVCEPTAAALADAIREGLEADPPPEPAVEEWLNEYDWATIADSISAALLPDVDQAGRTDGDGGQAGRTDGGPGRSNGHRTGRTDDVLAELR